MKNIFAKAALILTTTSTVILTVTLRTLSANAAVTLVDHDEWKAMMAGFVEADMLHDSTRSFNEVVGNNPVARAGTYAGDNARTQYSLRNTRLAFTVIPPVQKDWRTKGYFEFDFFGYDPAISATAPTNSESSFYTSPALRMRHAYISGDKDGSTFLVGQTWTLFGWQPNYFMTTASVPPVSGLLYERTPQVTWIKNITLNDTDTLQTGVSVTRPPQTDAEYPGLDAGVRWITQSRKAGYTSPSGDPKLEGMSLGLSGTTRQFLVPNAASGSQDVQRFTGSAGAVDFLIPLMKAQTQDIDKTLALTGEYTSGQGYGDEFNGWSGNLAQTTSGTVPSANPNLDAGQGGYDAGGNFQLVRLQTWNMQLQYHRNSDCHTFYDLGFGELSSSNVGTLTNVAAGKFLYDRAQVYYVNMFKDLTSQIRVAGELDRFTTRYVDGNFVMDTRVQASALFRF